MPKEEARENVGVVLRGSNEVLFHSLYFLGLLGVCTPIAMCGHPNALLLARSGFNARPVFE